MGDVNYSRLVGQLRDMADNKALPIGEAWDGLERAADAIEALHIKFVSWKIGDELRELDARRAFMKKNNYRPCDIPGCPCNAWHQSSNP